MISEVFVMLVVEPYYPLVFLQIIPWSVVIAMHFGEAIPEIGVARVGAFQ